MFFVTVFLSFFFSLFSGIESDDYSTDEDDDDDIVNDSDATSNGGRNIDDEEETDYDEPAPNQQHEAQRQAQRQNI